MSEQGLTIQIETLRGLLCRIASVPVKDASMMIGILKAYAGASANLARLLLAEKSLSSGSDAMSQLNEALAEMLEELAKEDG